MPERVLLLGGTREAGELAGALAGVPGIETTYSLAGCTRRPAPVPVPVRTGGFGGADGLAAYLRSANIDLVVDATHPYAQTMSRHAAVACERRSVPRLVLHRPPWVPDPRDRWCRVPDTEGAARALPGLGRRALLTVGSRELAPFKTVEGVEFVVRAVEPPAPALALDPTRFEIVLARGPFDLDAECRLLEARAIDVIVSKNGGGTAARAKLVAARALGLPVVMIARPPPPPGERVESVAAARAWIEAYMRRT